MSRVMPSFLLVHHYEYSMSSSARVSHLRLFLLPIHTPFPL